MPQIEQELRQFVINNFLFGQDGDKLADDDSFLKKGITDSTGVLELVSFLEERYQIKLKDDEVVPSNLDSINNIVSFLKRKCAIA